MFFGYDLKEILMFPFKDVEARKYLLIGGLVALTAFFIPVLPYLVLFGYSAQIAKQVLKGEEPHMVPWEDWVGMLKEGAKLFGIRMVYSIPLIILIIPVIAGSIAMPLIAVNMDSDSANTVISLFTVIMAGSFCILIPLSIPLAILIPTAEMHSLDKDEFAAGFRVKEWWPILRANLGGFIVAFGIYYFASMALAIIIQILAATIILACLLLVFVPAMTIYITLIMFTTMAVAYRDGKAKLSQDDLVLQTT